MSISRMVRPANGQSRKSGNELSDARDTYLAKERARLEAEAPAEARAAAEPLAEAVRDAIRAQTGP